MPVSKMPVLRKKPVPEEKVPVPVPVAKKAPPPRGRICLRPLTKVLLAWEFLLSSLRCPHV